MSKISKTTNKSKKPLSELRYKKAIGETRSSASKSLKGNGHTVSKLSSRSSERDAHAFAKSIISQHKGLMRNLAKK